MEDDLRHFTKERRVTRRLMVRDSSGKWAIATNSDVFQSNGSSSKESRLIRISRAPATLSLLLLATTGCGVIRQRSINSAPLAFAPETSEVKEIKVVKSHEIEETSSMPAPKNKDLALIGVSLCETPSCDASAEPESHLELPTPSLAITPEVRKEIEHFSQVDPNFIRGALPGRNIYYRRIARIFERHGVPVDFINLAIVESRFRPEARSNAGAVGIWQFMPHTASQFGLDIKRKDERKDPIRSSVAAARYLRTLFSHLGDWWLALAAYNSGLGRIQRLVEETGQYDFWRLARAGKLPLETARFVPRFIAVTMILNEPEKYGVDRSELEIRAG